ncbi:hypothetical protein NDU88_001801, partial [Pleurodeles waltl]
SLSSVFPFCLGFLPAAAGRQIEEGPSPPPRSPSPPQPLLILLHAPPSLWSPSALSPFLTAGPLPLPRALVSPAHSYPTVPRAQTPLARSRLPSTSGHHGLVRAPAPGSRLPRSGLE